MGWYASIPDFTDSDAVGGNPDRTLGLLRSNTIPYRAVLEGVERCVTVSGRETVVEYETPAGSIRTASLFTEEMLQAGVSTSWITEPAIRQPDDIDVVGYIFSHIRVVPEPERYMALRRQVGECGVAVAFASGASCPLQHIMRTLMPVEDFFYALSDCPERIDWLVEQMEPYYEGIRDAAAGSGAEVVLLGGNYADSITPPPFFRKHILPRLRSYADSLHARGMYLMTHTDGENRSLLPLYLEAGGGLSFDAPAAGGANFDEYVSDPAKPVPYGPRPIVGDEGAWRTWLLHDQRFVDGRPDVLTYMTAPLTAPMKLAGEPIVHLIASTTGTDSDWVVKLIDVYPNDQPTGLDTAGAFEGTLGVQPDMSGYELPLAIDIFRGRYRVNFSQPESIIPNKPLEYKFALPNVDHTFAPRHRIMVQIQSTLFPLYDRNPQTFVPNIFRAKPQDFIKATQRIWHESGEASYIDLPVMENSR